MKTSWNSIRMTEEYLSNRLSPEDRLIFEARILIDPVLKMNVFLQKKIYSLVRAYGRKQLKSELQSIEHRLFQSPEKIEFQQRVSQIFKD